MSTSTAKPDQYAAPVVVSDDDFNNLPHDNGAARLNTVIWLLASISGLFLALRVYCKFLKHRGLWWDDIFLIGAWISCIIECAFLTHVTTLGYGRHIWDFDMANMSKLAVFMNLSGTFSVMGAIWSKTSFAITLLKVTDGWVKRGVWFIIVSINITMGLSALFPWVNCTPVRKAWDIYQVGECWAPEVMVYYNMFSAAYSAFMDIVLAFIPWTVIWGLQMRKKEKIGVAVAMSMGIFAGVTGFVKTSKVPLMLSDDFADGVDLFIWGNAESAITIIAASIPILRVLIRDVAQTRRYHKTGIGGKTGMSGSTKLPSTVVTTVSGGRDKGDIARKKRDLDDDSDKSILGNDGDRTPRTAGNKIVQTNDFSVEYHQRKDSDEFEMHRV
ncbi:hypothetical protein B0T17DRAFT_492545 [Bombardia bombarda]|uniref:Rhodopsin domain-containing protein n=1 Tax=Bombardia bombarda TaxID=252184 RepID=A0AA40C3Y8_9PEZI|nr:hypothetical protein B0T17DRAFT_492545 [Bombardia bombarda]